MAPNFLALTTLLALLLTAAAQIAYDPETNSLVCSKPGGSYCASGSLEGPTIITCASQHTVEISSCNLFLKDLLPEGYEEKATCYETTSSAGDALCAFNGTGYAIIKKSRDVVPVSVPETILCSDEHEDSSQSLDDAYDAEDAFDQDVEDEDVDEYSDEYSDEYFDEEFEEDVNDDSDADYPDNDEQEKGGNPLFTPVEDTSAGPTLPIVPPLLPATHLRKASSTSKPSLTLIKLLSMTSTPPSATETTSIQEEKSALRKRACSDPGRIPPSSFSIQDMGFSTLSSDPTSTMDSPTAAPSGGYDGPLSTFTSTIYASRFTAVTAPETVTIIATKTGTPISSTGVGDGNPETETTPVKTSDASHTSESGSELRAMDDSIVFQDLAVIWVMWVVFAYIFV
ncbi:uncharacterized protein BO88DRAFT_463789 [Aspergillus vadensis CBS 113365]|uniref:Uncharacterized protein n=1 Tax=Aspergillus vadensis (strain CBS 113365 / IMI 142717 / IBT 24658) TaxID=1448311 RepID=A0A319BZH2_ASPVC|nr:hypothetical protein BO88DRAFT_463789 [Aspergillus vadensis CBS 113365]PYH68568.1 hypothetical protein BO88DRAFT_463789 [Aspergillus vadensis CBS 113365]